MNIREVCERLARAYGADAAAAKAKVGYGTFRRLWTGGRSDEDLPAPAAALRTLLAATPWPPPPKPEPAKVPPTPPPPPTFATPTIVRMSELVPKPAPVDEPRPQLRIRGLRLGRIR